MVRVQPLGLGLGLTCWIRDVDRIRIPKSLTTKFDIGKNLIR